MTLKRNTQTHAIGLTDHVHIEFEGDHDLVGRNDLDDLWIRFDVTKRETHGTDGRPCVRQRIHRPVQYRTSEPFLDLGQGSTRDARSLRVSTHEPIDH